MEKKEYYLSPSVKVIEMKGNSTICASSTGTEPYGASSNSYGDDDWE